MIVGCSGFGFSIAASYRYYTKLLQQLMRVLSTMECELQYRMTPLPELCRISAEICTGSLRNMFICLAEKLDANTEAHVSHCMLQIVSATPSIPKSFDRILLMLGDSLGRYDLEGQIKGINYVRGSCKDMLDRNLASQDVRVRSYQTLGICAGVALAIILI